MSTATTRKPRGKAPQLRLLPIDGKVLQRNAAAAARRFLSTRSMANHYRREWENRESGRVAPGGQYGTEYYRGHAERWANSLAFDERSLIEALDRADVPAIVVGDDVCLAHTRADGTREVVTVSWSKVWRFES